METRKAALDDGRECGRDAWPDFRIQGRARTSRTVAGRTFTGACDGGYDWRHHGARPLSWEYPA